MMRTVERRAAALVNSVVLIAMFLFGLPTVLVAVAHVRFGGAAPLHGVPSPVRWETDAIREAMTDRLTNEMVADIVIRCSLVVGWFAVSMLLFTVVAEFIHMLRHGGISMPDVRGVVFEQRIARVIATGLLVLAPTLASAPRALAGGVARHVEPVSASVVIEDAPANAEPASLPQAMRRPVVDTDLAVTDGFYVVQAGDSVYGIASRLAGPDQTSIADCAEQIVDLNLGSRMVDGQMFSNAAFVDVGWILQLPSSTGSTPDPSAADQGAGTHIVQSGESLWSIAADELGDPNQWPTLFDANSDREFGDGRRLGDADLILPGWELELSQNHDAGSVQPVITAVPVARAIETSASIDDTVDLVVSTAADIAIDVVEPVIPLDLAASRPVNSWIPKDVSQPSSQIASDGLSPQGVADATRSPKLITIERAAMLASGVLALAAVRRRRKLRSLGPTARIPQPRPRTQAVERRLRSMETGSESIARSAIRSAAPSLVFAGERPVAVLVADEGAIELIVSGDASLELPWRGGEERWTSTAAELLRADTSDAELALTLCPAMVHLGRDDAGRDVFVDLEALGALEVGGSDSEADSIVAAIASTLASSKAAETATLIGFGVDEAAFLEHRFFVPCDHEAGALAAARDEAGSLAAASTFEDRCNNNPDPCGLAAVLVGSQAGTFTMPVEMAGLAVVSASPLSGPSSRLAPDGEIWQLSPVGIRLSPIGLTPDDVLTLAELTSPDADDETVVGERIRSDASASPIEPLDSAILIRLLGPVSIGVAHGDEISFERSKTKELLAWLATHRDRSTRMAARTALWEIDVRDATFANVVSEARRSLGRMIAPPEAEEWVGRTMTDALPLHERVVTDVDILERAVESSSEQTAVDAIETLRPAVELIRGVPFEGTSYLWSDSEGITSRFVLIATSAAAQLAGHCLAIGDIDGVFSATGRGLRVLPGHEELIGLRMRAHAEAGDRAGVRQEWLSYERAMTADSWSDGEPSPKLVELRSELLNV